MLASHDALRPGLTEQEPADLAAALTRPEIYLILSGELSWSPRPDHRNLDNRCAQRSAGLTQS